METIKTIPEKQVTESVVHFVVFPTRKIISVLIHSTSGADREEVIDITNIWMAMTTTQKNIARGFFKAVAAVALSAKVIDITGELDFAIK